MRLELNFTFGTRFGHGNLAGSNLSAKKQLESTLSILFAECRLIVEVDGGQHADNARDQIRDQWLREHNYRIMRFWNHDVLGNTNGVLETILTALLAEAPPHPVASGDRPLPASGER